MIQDKKEESSKTPQFTMLPHALWTWEGITRNNRLMVMLGIMAHTNIQHKRNEAYPSLLGLAAKAGCRKDSVIAAIKWLEGEKLITVKRRGKRKNNLYTVNFDLFMCEPKVSLWEFFEAPNPTSNKSQGSQSDLKRKSEGSQSDLKHILEGSQSDSNYINNKTETKSKRLLTSSSGSSAAESGTDTTEAEQRTTTTTTMNNIENISYNINQKGKSIGSNEVRTDTIEKPIMERVSIIDNDMQLQNEQKQSAIADSQFIDEKSKQVVSAAAPAALEALTEGLSSLLVELNGSCPIVEAFESKFLAERDCRPPVGYQDLAKELRRLNADPEFWIAALNNMFEYVNNNFKAGGKRNTFKLEYLKTLLIEASERMLWSGSEFIDIIKNEKDSGCIKAIAYETSVSDILLLLGTMSPNELAQKIDRCISIYIQTHLKMYPEEQKFIKSIFEKSDLDAYPTWKASILKYVELRFPEVFTHN